MCAAITTSPNRIAFCRQLITRHLFFGSVPFIRSGGSAKSATLGSIHAFSSLSICVSTAFSTQPRSSSSDGSIGRSSSDANSPRLLRI